jgi:ankyrin repeat protein
MAVPPHGYLEYNRAIPQGGDTALLLAVRAGDLESAKLLVAAGADINDASAWGVTATAMAAHSGYRELVGFLLDQGADPNPCGAGFTALHAAIMRRDEKMVTALLDHGADPNTPLQNWTPTRRASQDLNFPPSLVGATPFWLAARYNQPNVMRLLEARGADPLFVYHADYVAGEAHVHRTDTATAVMAAVGLGGGGRPWVDVKRSEREALTLDAVKMLTDLGVDLNVAGTDGRTALDAARALKYATVVAFLIDHGAKTGSGKKAPVDEELK